MTEDRKGVTLSFGAGATKRIQERGITNDDIKFAADYVSELIGKNKRTGHFSIGLWGELTALYVLGDADITEIFNEISYLEGISSQSNTKLESQFKGGLLHPFWHKHYFQAQFIPNNLLNELRRDDTVERVWGPLDGQTITQKMIDDLVTELVAGNLERRDQDSRLTGEWIVYHIHNGNNFYLTLGRHDEGDQVIKDRIDGYIKDGRYL